MVLSKMFILYDYVQNQIDETINKLAPATKISFTALTMMTIWQTRHYITEVAPNNKSPHISKII